MTENNNCTLMQCGRKISEQEIEQICETVDLFPRLAMRELVSTICEHLGWHTAAGGLKENAWESRIVNEMPAKPNRTAVHPVIGRM